MCNVEAKKVNYDENIGSPDNLFELLGPKVMRSHNESSLLEELIGL